MRNVCFLVFVPFFHFEASQASPSQHHLPNGIKRWVVFVWPLIDDTHTLLPGFLRRCFSEKIAVVLSKSSFNNQPYNESNDHMPPFCYWDLLLLR